MLTRAQFPAADRLVDVVAGDCTGSLVVEALSVGATDLADDALALVADGVSLGASTA